MEAERKNIFIAVLYTEMKLEKMSMYRVKNTRANSNWDRPEN
jgi:hypothetical protein